MLIGSPSSSIAQSYQGGQVTFSIGVHKHNELDRIASSLEYDGNIVPLKVSYEHLRGRRLHYVGFQFQSGTLSNPFTRNTRSYEFYELEYAYSNKLYRISTGGQPVLVDWGLAWINRGAQVVQTISNGTLPDNGYLFSSAAFLLRGSYSIGNHHLQYRIDLPLAVYLFRPTYQFTGSLDSGTFYPGTDLPYAGNRLQYRYRLNDKFTLGLHLDYTLNRLGEPNRYRSVDRSIQFSTTIKL